jgi:hypothetical protein
VCCAVLRCQLCLRCWVRLRCRLCLNSLSLAVSLALFASWPCSYSPLLLSQLFAFCVLWCLAFLLRNAVLCVLSCFLIADCFFSSGLVNVISHCEASLILHCSSITRQDKHQNASLLRNCLLQKLPEAPQLQIITDVQDFQKLQEGKKLNITNH